MASNVEAGKERDSISPSSNVSLSSSTCLERFERARASWEVEMSLPVILNNGFELSKKNSVAGTPAPQPSSKTLTEDEEEEERSKVRRRPS